MEKWIKRWGLTIWLLGTIASVTPLILFAVRYGYTEEMAGESIWASMSWGGIVLIVWLLSSFVDEILESDPVKKAHATVCLLWWTRIWWPSVRLDEQKTVAICKVLRFLGEKAETIEKANKTQSDLLVQYRMEVGEAYHIPHWDDDALLEFIRDFGRATISASREAANFQKMVNAFEELSIIPDEFKGFDDFGWWLKVEHGALDMSGDPDPTPTLAGGSRPR